MNPGQLKSMGVVGAGGAGFPTYVKAGARVEFVLGNGAECEPLVHKDAELMEHHAPSVVEGLRIMMRMTGAARGLLGIKTKNARAMEAVRSRLSGASEGIVELGDFYPSGDEYELVYSATGRLIPPAGIPLQAGCVVNNVETLHNVCLAEQGTPVTRKFVSVVGAVREPKSFWTPVGTRYGDLLEAAGGAATPDFALFVSGIMMGSLSFSLDDVVTKTTAGLIVLPREHYLVKRKTRTPGQMARIGKSACDQCSYCTEFCPRYLLGYEVVPHRVMRGLGFTSTGAPHWNQFAQLCCACGLCTLYACPEDLYPKEACDDAKSDFRAAGMKFTSTRPVTVHPMKEHRRVPLAMLRKRLRVEEFEAAAPFVEAGPNPAVVRIKLSQHAGVPAQPCVAAGASVRAGEAVGHVPEDALGASVHASIDGAVTAVTPEYVEISR